LEEKSVEQKIDRSHYSYKVYEDPSIAENFDQDRFGGDVGAYFREYQEQLVERLLPDVNKWQIIDIGSGTGRIALPLSKRGAMVTATDASFQMITITRDKAWLQGYALKTLRSDAHFLPFNDRVFDAVISFRMLMHVIDWQKALSEICRISKAKVLIDFPPKCGFAGLSPWVHCLKKWFKRNYQPYKVFSISEILKVLQQNGFNAVVVDRHMVMPFGFHRIIGSRTFTTSLEGFFKRTGLSDLFGAPVTILAQRKLSR
jgi:ubiquinone/menaquinone biosynthesis C-methylase UbiE